MPSVVRASLRRVLTTLVVGLVLPLTALAAPASAEGYRLDTTQIFTIFFITLGPLKLLGPFAHATRRLNKGQLHSLAWKAAAIGIVALGAGGFMGRALMANWMIPPVVLELTAGLIFFLVALKTVLEQYEGGPTSPGGAPAAPEPMKIAFPMLVTPYGIAGVIVLLALSQDASRTLMTFAMLAVVMVLNLLSMIFVRRIMRPACITVLQVLGAVLGVMQVALSITVLLAALRILGLAAPTT